jgi:hypothetical protein
MLIPLTVPAAGGEDGKLVELIVIVVIADDACSLLYFSQLRIFTNWTNSRQVLSTQCEAAGCL